MNCSMEDRPLELAWSGYENFASYQAENPDELMEYAWLKPKFSGLNVDVFVDDGGAYLRHEHPLWVYFRNGYSKSDNVLPISVDAINPRVLVAQYDLNISAEDFASIVRFVKINAELLVAFVDRRLSHMEFFCGITPGNYGDV